MHQRADPTGDHCQEAPAAYGANGYPWASLSGAHAFLAMLERDHPQWFHQMDRLDPCASDTADLHAVLALAPHPYLAGMVHGMLVMRVRFDGTRALKE